MKRFPLALLPILLAAGLLPVSASADAPPDATPPGHQKTEEQLTAIADGLQPKHGKITLENGVATLDVPEGFDFLDAGDARKVIVDLFGNPPNVADGVLGMIKPAGQRMDEAKSWGATVAYLDEGYVKDDDAEKINYDDLLKQMQKGMEDHNAERTKDGYAALHLVGWAQPPHYDKASKKLYWAKELASDGNPNHSLNYEIRILGRRGILVVEPIARMQELDEVTTAAPQILNMIEFNQGNRYAEFNPKTDKVAPYALAGLIGGGLLLGEGGRPQVAHHRAALREEIRHRRRRGGGGVLQTGVRGRHEGRHRPVDPAAPASLGTRCRRPSEVFPLDTSARWRDGWPVSGKTRTHLGPGCCRVRASPAA